MNGAVFKELTVAAAREVFKNIAVQSPAMRMKLTLKQLGSQHIFILMMLVKL
jgi:hypothetical protein